MSFWFKPRQVVLMDAHGGRPARNFYVRSISVFLFLLLLTSIPFALGAWYAPFHSIQDIIPENIQLKRQNQELQRSLADAYTLNTLKDEQLESLQEQIGVQEREVLALSKELLMFNSILEGRKGKGVQIVTHKAHWSPNHFIAWQVLVVKGGSYPRYLAGSYKVFAIDDAGNRLALGDKSMRYRFESHAVLTQKFEWNDSWKPTKLELIIYNSRKKEVLKQVIQIQGM
ncbi:MAG: hypothetical protein L3J61_00030 [Ghiorsea sp.]|nr:hypothetical protein [Ghiorsea sp.]